MELSRIRIDVVQVETLCEEMDRRLSSLQRLKEDVHILRSRVSPSIQARRSIEDRLRSADQHLEQIELKMKRLNAFCRYGVESYRHADNRVNEQAKSFLVRAFFDEITTINRNAMGEEEIAYRTLFLAIVKATRWISGTIEAYRGQVDREARELLRDPRLDSDRGLPEGDQSLIRLLIKKFDQAKRTHHVEVMKRTKEMIREIRQGRMTNKDISSFPYELIVSWQMEGEWGEVNWKINECKIKYYKEEDPEKKQAYLKQMKDYQRTLREHGLYEDEINYLKDPIVYQPESKSTLGEIGRGLLQILGGAGEMLAGGTLATAGTAASGGIAGPLAIGGGFVILTEGASELSGGFSRIFHVINGTYAGDTANFTKNAFLEIFGQDGEMYYTIFSSAAGGAAVVVALPGALGKVAGSGYKIGLVEGAGHGQWYKADGTINYPPNNGAVFGTERTISLEKGQTLGRYGNVSSTSDYVTAPGASPSTLSLPPSTNKSIYTEYVVVRPIPKTVQSEVASWGGDLGGGLQYKLPMPIEQLLKDGYIIKK